MFRDRRDAGQQLAHTLQRYRSPDVIVLGLPRGGVPVAAEVADILGAPLDVIVVRKLGAPHQPELAVGAVGEGGVMVVNHGVLRQLGLDEADLSEIAARERETVTERAERFRPRRPRLALDGKTALIVDDGLATGSTARAACAVARAAGASKVVLAVPVAPSGVHPQTWPEVDEFACLQQPPRFSAVGQFYEDFMQTSDDEVLALLDRARSVAAEHPPPVLTGPGADWPLCRVSLFEEPGRLEEAARLARNWFRKHLGGPTAELGTGIPRAGAA